MEVAPEWQAHVFRAVPGRHEHRALVAQQTQDGGQCGGIAGALDRERDTGRRSDGGSFVGIDRDYSEICCYFAPPPLRLNRNHVATCLLDQATHEHSEDAESAHDDSLTEHRSGVEGDLQCSFDVGEEDSEPWIQPCDWK